MGRSTPAGDSPELSGLERPPGFRAGIAQRDELSQAAMDVLLPAAQDEHAVAGAVGPEPGFDSDESETSSPTFDGLFDVFGNIS